MYISLHVYTTVKTYLIIIVKILNKQDYNQRKCYVTLINKINAIGFYLVFKKNSSIYSTFLLVTSNVYFRIFLLSFSQANAWYLQVPKGHHLMSAGTGGRRSQGLGSGPTAAVGRALPIQLSHIMIEVSTYSLISQYYCEFRNRLISAGLELDLSDTEKSCIAS